MLKEKNNIFIREIPLISKEGFNKLEQSHILVFGQGGVGGILTENLVRCGVGEVSIVDHDTVDLSNINRQIIATTKNVGCYKVDEAEKRLKDINPNLKVNKYKLFVDENTINQINFDNVDYIACAIDTVSAKVLIAKIAYSKGIKVISSMAAGNRIDPNKFKISDIYKTTHCSIARIMRKKLKEANVKKLTVLYSTEEVNTNNLKHYDFIPSICFTPQVAGILIARHIILDLLKGGV